MSLAILKKRRIAQGALRHELEAVFHEGEAMCSSDLSTLEAAVLSDYLETLESVSFNLKEIHTEIVDLIEEEKEVAPQVSEHFKFERRIKKAAASAKIVLYKISKDTATNLDSSISTNTSIRANKGSAKLPKLNIKAFDGNPLHWKTFSDSFLEMIDKADISDIEKFSYLRSYLIGPAEETLSGLSLTSENYKVALEMLTNRFGDNQVLISAHMTSLLKVDVIRSVKDSKGLRKIFDSIEAQIRSLENLGIKPEQYGPMLIPILTSKFPDELNLILSRKMGRGVWDISNALDILTAEIEARERLSTTSKFNDTTHTPYCAESLLTDSRIYHASSSGLKNKFKDFNKTLKCVFCESEKHLAQNCDIITEVSIRKTILSNKKRCFKCLRLGHFSSKCQSKISCFSCSQNHHAALCFNKPKENKVIKESVISNFVSGSKTIGLLQTAFAQVFTINKEKTLNVRILFDSGSQLSFVSHRVRHLLNLPALERNNITVKTFGKNQADKLLDTVEFFIKGVVDDTFIHVKGLVDNICLPISGQIIDTAKQNYSHLQSLVLADRNSDGKDLPVDILIGANYYWSFISGRIIKSRTGSGPVALESKLGYILSGECQIPSQYKSVHQNFVETTVLTSSSELTEKQVLHKTLQNLWETPCDDKHNDSEIVQKFKNSLDFNGKRYQVKLPFKENFDVISDNYELSKNRLKSLARKFNADYTLYEEYEKIIDYQLETGIVEIVPADEISTQMGQVHYLPHKAVVRKDKTSTKVRVVFDASACDRSAGWTVIDCLVVWRIASV